MNSIFIKSKINLFTIYDMIFPLELVSTVHDMDGTEVLKNESKCQPTTNHPRKQVGLPSERERQRWNETENEKKNPASTRAN